MNRKMEAWSNMLIAIGDVFKHEMPILSILFQNLFQTSNHKISQTKMKAAKQAKGCALQQKVPWLWVACGYSGHEQVPLPVFAFPSGEIPRD